MAHILQSRNCASNGLKATAGGAHIKAKKHVCTKPVALKPLSSPRFQQQTAFHSQRKSVSASLCLSWITKQTSIHFLCNFLVLGMKRWLLLTMRGVNNKPKSKTSFYPIPETRLWGCKCVCVCVNCHTGVTFTFPMILGSLYLKQRAAMLEVRITVNIICSGVCALRVIFKPEPGKHTHRLCSSPIWTVYNSRCRVVTKTLNCSAQFPLFT